jgi:hypothetical protein
MIVLMDTPELPDKDILLTLFAECSAAMRERSQAEYLYTAAAAANFGAVCWGVAALQAALPTKVAAIGILVTAAIVTAKIWTQHRRYAEFIKERARIAELLSTLPGASGAISPVFRNAEAGRGALYSIAVLWGFGAAAFLFCTSRFW